MEYSDNQAALVYSEYEYYGNFTEPREWDFEDHTSWVVHNVLDSLAMVLGLLANALLLMLFSKEPLPRTVPSMFMLQRSVADMLLLMVLPFVIYERVHYHFQLSSTLCTTLTIIMHGALVASNVFLMLFTMDNYLVSRPLQYTLTYRRKVMRMTSVAAWLLAAVVAVGIFFYYSYLHYAGCFFYEIFIALHLHDIIIHLVVPLVVVWVFVNMTLCCRHAEPSSMPKAEEGCESPNRLLLLSLSSSFTVMRILFSLGIFLEYGYIYADRVIIVIAFSIPNLEKVVNPILVICLTERLRQKVVRWLPARHSAVVPLQDL